MNVFKQLYKSMYSPRDIAIFRFQGIGKTILYVFLLTFISILPVFYHFSVAIVDGIKTAEKIVRDELPDFTIKDGRLETTENKSVTIEREGFSITLDPTGSVTTEDIGDLGNSFGLLKDEFVLATGGRTQSYPYTMIETSKVTRQDFLDVFNSMDGIGYIILPIVFFFLLLVSAAMKFVEVTVLAGVGVIYRNIGGRRLNFGHLWRMSAYSATISTIFFTIMDALKTPVSGGFLINWFVSSIVLYLAIKETPKPKSAAGDSL